MSKVLVLFLIVLWLPTHAQEDLEVKSSNPALKTRVVDTKAKTLKMVVDPSTVVSFESARTVDMMGKKVDIQLEEKVTLVEYWSRNAADTNLYWNQTRDLENKYKDDPNVQIISINYDFALGGEPQRKAAEAYLKTVTPPQHLLLDQDDGIREIFSLTGAIGYMLFNHNQQFIAVGRGDDTEAQKVFAEFDKAVAEKVKWNKYVEKTMKEINQGQNKEKK